MPRTLKEDKEKTKHSEVRQKEFYPFKNALNEKGELDFIQKTFIISTFEGSVPKGLIFLSQALRVLSSLLHLASYNVISLLKKMTCTA